MNSSLWLRPPLSIWVNGGDRDKAAHGMEVEKIYGPPTPSPDPHGRGRPRSLAAQPPAGDVGASLPPSSFLSSSLSICQTRRVAHVTGPNSAAALATTAATATEEGRRGKDHEQGAEGRGRRTDGQRAHSNCHSHAIGGEGQPTDRPTATDRPEAGEVVLSFFVRSFAPSLSPHSLVPAKRPYRPRPELTQWHGGGDLLRHPTSRDLSSEVLKSEIKGERSSARRRALEGRASGPAGPTRSFCRNGQGNERKEEREGIESG